MFVCMCVVGALQEMTMTLRQGFNQRGRITDVKRMECSVFKSEEMESWNTIMAPRSGKNLSSTHKFLGVLEMRKFFSHID